MRAFVVAVVAILVFAASAEAATGVRVTAPPSATTGAKVSVKLSGPKTGKVRVYLLTRTSVRKSDKPLTRGKFKRGKVTFRITVPATARMYRIVACLEGRKLRCAKAKKLLALTAPKPVASAPAVAVPAKGSDPVVELPGRPLANPHAVTLVSERGRTETSRIGPAGGVVSATGADGTTYAVRIPAGALAAYEDISVSPAGEAMLLEPAGLGFVRPADASISYSGVSDPLAWTSQVDGSEAHLVPQTFDDAGAVHVSLRRLVPVGITLEDWSSFVPSGEADVAQYRIALAQARWARGTLTTELRNAEIATALKRWRAFLSFTDFEVGTTDFLAWQDAGGSDTALTAAHSASLLAAADSASAACQAGSWASLGKLILYAALDRELGYGLGIDGSRLTGCGKFSVQRTVSYSYDTDAYSDASWDYSASHRSYTTKASGSLAYEVGDPTLDVVLPTTASDWQISRQAVARGGLDCRRDWMQQGTPTTGSTPVELELPANLGVTRTPALRMLDGAQGISLPYGDFPDGFDCEEPPRPFTEPAAAGVASLALDASGRASARVPATDILGRSVTETTVTLVHTP